MKLNLIVENMGKVTLTDRNYIAAGGEASVYTSGRTAFKIYHDSKKMIPLDKIQELNQISAKNVLKPKNIIRDKSGTAIGYTMKYIKTTHPICKLFTKAFKQKNRLSEQDIVELIKKIQLTVAQIHKDKCLIVDFNEMNLLTSSKCDVPFFIDVDSYQTPSHRATAIMESIRDRSVKNNNFTEMSDWFSFAVLITQLYIGIHSHKGSHPDYKKNAWMKRMDDGVSIFDPKVTLPKVCNPLSVIPPLHRSWLEAIFLKNDRSIPPMVDAVVVALPMPTAIIEGTEDFETTVVETYDDPVISIFNFMGVNYAITTKGLYKEKNKLPHTLQGGKVSFCESSDMSPIICKLEDELLTFEDATGNEIGKINALGMTYRNGAIYSIYSDKLVENTFERFGNKIVHDSRVAANILDLSTKVFDGVVFQDLLGKPHITLPFEKGKCITKAVPELKGYRIIEAKSEKNICVVMAERKGAYCRFVLIFNDTFTAYEISKAEDVTYAPINFTVMPNGLCIMAVDSEVQVFKGTQVKVINDPPFNPNTKLFNASGGVFFIDDNKVYSVKMKK